MTALALCLNSPLDLVFLTVMIAKQLLLLFALHHLLLLEFSLLRLLTLTEMVCELLLIERQQPQLLAQLLVSAAKVGHAM